MQTEFEFELPRGYVDESGNIHRHGTMRLALAMDEIIPMRDIRVQDNRAYATILILARVVTRLGAVEAITPALLEVFFAGDLNYLQDFYRQINDDLPSSDNHSVSESSPASAAVDGQAVSFEEAHVGAIASFSNA